MSKRTIFLAGTVILAAMARLIDHPPNMTPIGAMALFGGACRVDRRLAFVLPLVAMLLSDLVLGYTKYGLLTIITIQPVVYGAILASTAIGRWITDRRSVLQVGGAVLAGSVLFFLITNFGHWVLYYPNHSLATLTQCYIDGIPFFRFTLLGDVTFSTILFGGLALLENRVAWMRERSAPVPA